MEAQRDDTDVGEVYTRLANLGFNKQSLTIDQVAKQNKQTLIRFDFFLLFTKLCAFVCSSSHVRMW